MSYTGPLHAWLLRHDSHGLSFDTLVFLPPGETPDTEGDWYEAPWLDSDPTDGKEERVAQLEHIAELARRHLSLYPQDSSNHPVGFWSTRENLQAALKDLDESL